MSSQLSTLQGELKEYEEQLETVQSSLQADPDNAELQTLKTELEEIITLTQAQIDELVPVPAPATPTQPQASQPPKEKWSKENHPAYQAGYRGKPAATAITSPTSPTDNITTSSTYKVNDTVLARWVSGDKAFYPARITSITGSAAAPVYYVTFKSYNTAETLRSVDIKPLPSDSRKRRWADDEPMHASAAPITSSAGAGSQQGSIGVISAAANINPALADQAKKEPSKVSDGPARPPKVPRKVKANKELEAGKSKWQDFTAKGKHGKGARKESMFRTGDGVNARVGFTGSGQAMRKDPSRSKHIYQTLDDDY
jgi:survival-of-motor-neuron-related-splicing factor 30